MKISLLIIVIIIALSLSSCNVYNPAMADIPLIKHRKDLRLDGGVAVLKPAAYATASFGLTNHIAIQGYGAVGLYDWHYMQAAVGTFNKLTSKTILEFYGGIGHGYGNAQNSKHRGNYYGHYQVYFGQFNIGFLELEPSKSEIGIGLKAGIINSNLTDKNYFSFYSEQGPFENKQNVNAIVEPSINLKFGLNKTRVNFRMSGTHIFRSGNKLNEIPYGKLNLGFGLNF